MKKRISIFFVLTLCFNMTFAQSEEEYKGVKFRNVSLEEAIQIAKAEGKRVFVDFYTQWCGPCKAIAENVFPTDTAGLFFNQRFVNIKIDVGVPDGKHYADKYFIDSVPTFIIFEPDGSIRCRWMGASYRSTAERFINIVQKNLGEIISVKEEAGNNEF